VLHVIYVVLLKEIQFMQGFVGLIVRSSTLELLMIVNHQQENHRKRNRQNHLPRLQSRNVIEVFIYFIINPEMNERHRLSHTIRERLLTA
jgi:hypothetical protein